VQTNPIDHFLNPFPHGHNLAHDSLSMEGVGQGPPLSLNNPSSTNVYMKGNIDIMTRTCDYRMPTTYENGKEAENSSLPL
jgi:hypothetical protein